MLYSLVSIILRITTGCIACTLEWVHASNVRLQQRTLDLDREASEQGRESKFGGQGIILPYRLKMEQQ